MSTALSLDTPIEASPKQWHFRMKLNLGLKLFKRLILNASVLLFAEILGLFVAYEAAALSLKWALGHSLDLSWFYLSAAIWGIGSIAWGLLPGWGLSAFEALRRQVLLCIGTFLVITLLDFDTGGRIAGAVCCIAAMPLIPAFRILAKNVLVHRKTWGTPVAIYGGGSAGREIIKRFRADPGKGYHPVCVFDDNPELANTSVEGVPVCGFTDSIAKNVPIAILAITRIEGEKIGEMMQHSLSSYLRVILIPNLIHSPSLWATSRDMCGVPGLELKNNLLDPTLRVVKSCFEAGVAMLTLPFWGSLFAALYALIWLDDRKNPIYKQKRIGQRGEVFDTWKFRTMVPDADKVLEQHLEADPELKAEWEANCKLVNDPRITRMGKFLRKTSLDEIPQLVNILKGEMSLIGPRPLPDYHYNQLPDSVRMLRERVKPGITGLWQVSGRSDAGNEGMVRWDPYYVRNWSLWLDIVILFRTVRVVLTARGAR
ncbi:MAG: exopolysaccharide biosynthesis polyprenyl glycosylphosphotransferase [Opitutales bacterium]